MAIQDIIKERRLELGLTLKDVADALGVAESTVSRYETSYIANMKIDKLKALSDVLQCTPGYLMGWDEKTVPEGFDAQVGKLLVDVRKDPNLRELVQRIGRLNRYQQENLLLFVRSMQPDERPEQLHEDSPEYS